MDILRVEKDRFVDESGRHVLLSGVNLVCKEKHQGYVAPCGEELFAWFEGQGYNALRLGLIWDGVEPRPGHYDDDYLARIGEQIQWAERHGMWVFLDMHQDLYGRQFADGAPDWATLTDGLPHVEGGVWSDAYLGSPAVSRAFDHFWKNDPAPDGIGLQDHYAQMWRHVAEFYRDYKNVIGYDLMNEPYPGSAGQAVFGALIEAFAQDAGETPEALSGAWFDDESRSELLAGLTDMAHYGKLAEAAAPPSQAFERESLAPFYEKVGAAVRAINPSALLILESNYFCNMGIECALPKVLGDGFVYSPHAYELGVDTEHYTNYCQARIEYILDAHLRAQRRTGAPAILGEWGAFPQKAECEELTRALLRVIEKNLWSQTYWCWHPDFKNDPSTRALRRAYPMSTAGELLSYRYDAVASRLHMIYAPEEGVSRVFHPNSADVRAIRGEIKNITFKPYGVVEIEAEPSGGPIELIIG